MAKVFAKKSRISILVAMLVLVLGVALGTFAGFGSEIEIGGEMTEIKDIFDADYLIQDTKRIEDDGYVGALQYTVYYDSSKGNVVTDIHGTPIIVYTVNTNTERVGTDSNESIISSMLERGYVVVVLDYMNQAKAQHPYLDDSVQSFTHKMKDGRYFPKSGVFPGSGTYKEIFVAPSGYDVLLNQVFWELDKHGADGSLEKVVENWNGDFKGTKAEKFVMWSYDGTVDGRKKVDTASDGSSPVWYDAAGKVDANGVYTKVKYTVAETFTDCVDPDGSPLETELYMHIVYPTHPENEVPVLSVASCSGYPHTTARSIELCSHHTGALFQGYAGAVYDYLWFPMARDESFGYYDGNFNTNGAVTGDHMNYALHLYNDKLVNTAAMRYLRYLALSDSETYSFAEDKYTVIGLSKGAWFSFLGEAVLQSELADPTLYTTTDALEDAIDLKLASFTPKRQFEGHHGETRYQAGNTETYESGVYSGEYAVEGGERQPWLTYEGKEILSGAQFTYAANGSQDEDISEGHSPFFVASHMYDDYGAAYGQGVILPNLSRTMDIPSVFFEVALPHTYAFGEDMNYGVDTYVAFFEFLNYYMKDAPAKVLYTNPRNGNGMVAVTDTVTVKFAGELTLEEIEKNVTVSCGGKAVSGKWSASYGDTEWTFAPDTAFKGYTQYTVTVSGNICGKNGTPLGEDYVSTFITEYDVATNATVTADNDGNAVFTFTAPALSEIGNKFAIRFAVENDAANVAGIYTAEGEKLGSVNLSGAGLYQVDVTDYVYANAGKTVSLTLKAEKEEAVIETNRDTLSGITVHNLATATVVMLDKDGNETTDAAKAYATAFKVTIGNNEGSYYNDVFYGNVTTAVTIGKLIGDANISRADYGRKFDISLKIFDTVDRTVQLKFNGMTSSADGTMDHNQAIVNVKTKAGQWVEVTVPYTVYETDYGVKSAHKKSMGIQISPSGDTELPVYLADFTVTEYVTGITVSSAEIAEMLSYGTDHKLSASENAFAVYNGETLVGEYTTWKAAFGAYKSGYTVKLQANYTLTDNDLYNGFGSFAQVNVDLDGYTITCANSKNSLLWLKNTSASVAKTTVTMTNGGIVLTDTPLITYGDSTVGGAGKSFDINLNDIYFSLGDGAMLTEGISASTVANGCVTNTSVRLNECFITAGERNRADVALNLLPAGAGDLTVNYRVTGGAIYLENQRWITVQNTANTSEFFAGKDGYTILYIPAPYAPADTSYLISDGFAKPTAAATANGLTMYVLKSGENSTRYGIIPDAYKDAEKYPLVLFKDGIFVGAYDTWYNAAKAAQTNCNGTENIGKQVEILLRRDYTNIEAGPILNSFTNIVLDLGGNKFLNSGVTIDLYGGYDAAPYKSTFTVRNGTFSIVRGIPVLDIQYSKAQSAEKQFEVVFDGITFEYNDNRAESLWGKHMLLTIWNNNLDDLGNHTDIYLNDCVIDVRNNMIADTITVFSASDTYKRADVDIYMNGGTILSGANTKIKMFAGDADDSMTVGSGSNGEYPVLKVTDGASPIADNFVTAEGENMHFTLSESGSPESTYTLSVNPLATPYGVISASCADVTKYPFVIFKNGNFVGGFGNFNHAMAGAKKNPGCVIYMRADFHIVKGGASSITDLNGSAILDLNGKTLSTEVYFLDQYVGTGNTAYTGSITIKNGTLLRKGGSPMIGLNQGAASNGTTKYMNFIFENVTIKNTNTGSNGILVDCWHNNTLQLCVDFVFNNCTFDFTGCAKNNTMIDAGTGKTATQVDIFINGGKIIADNLANYKIYTLGSEDTVTYGKGEDGEYTALVTPTATAPVTSTYPTANGNMYFVEYERDAETSKSTYYLTSMVTPYGTVPHNTITANPKYLSAIEYPFFLFQDGAFKRVDTNYGLAMSHVKDYTFAASGKTAVVYMRRDYQSASSIDATSGFLSQIGCTVIIDLNGYTYTANNYLFDAYARYTTVDGVNTVHPTAITIRNGNVVNNFAYPLINFNHGTNATVKVFDFAFEGVTFSDGAGKTDYLLLACWDNGDKQVDASMIFTDCVFDLRGMKKGASVFNTGASKKNTMVDIVINGGKIVTADIANVVLYKLGGEDSFVFGKGTDGNYTVLSQSVSAAIPSTVYVGANGESLGFAAIGAEGNNRLYRLAACVSTPYGEIPAAYADANAYPYAVFQNGQFLGAYLKWGDTDDATVNSALERAKNAINGSGSAGKTVVILVRADRTVTSAEQFNNFSQAGGTYIIDLDGHTLTLEHTLFGAHAKNTGNVSHHTYTEVKNGTILSKNSAVISLNSATVGGAYVNVKTFFFTFENVTFGLANGASTTTPIVSASNNQSAVGVNADIVFENCTFDFATVTPKAVTTLVSLAENSNTVHGKATFIGCTLVADNMDKVVLYTLGEKDTAVFVANDNGEYIFFRMDADAVVPDYDFRNAKGDKLIVSGSNGVYTLTAHTHNYSETVTAPTCTEGGYTTYTCTCGDTYVDNYTEATGHTYNITVTDPTCTDDGYTTYTCACGDSYIDGIVPAPGHVYDNEYDADCNNCGEIREVETPVTVVAEGVCGVNTTWVLTSDGVLTISGNGDTEDYLVSITTEQPYRAYADKITKVVIEEGVTSIGRGAFYGFTAITEVVLPESLIAIHEYAFFGCTAIKTVTIPENTFYIGMYAFRKTGLTSINFANAEGWKFADGTALDVTNVKAFTTEFTYKQTCMRPVYEDGEIIANGVFGNKDQFTWTLTSTGLLTVSGTGNMPKFNVNTTPWYGYRGAIRSVVIEEGITSVGRCAFHTCRAITSVTLPESLETIAEYAFYNCQFLTEATIPANVTRIEIYAFRKCFALKDVTFTLNYGWTAGDAKVSATELNSNAADMLTLVNYTKIWTRDINAEEEILDPNYVTGGACNTTVKWSLTYTDDSKTSMKLTISGTGAMPKFETAGTPWYGYLNDIVEVEVCEGITEIERCSFYGLKFVKVATIADTVTSINDYAFNGCFSLKGIVIPESVTYIAETAFTKTGLSEIPTV